MTSIEMALQKRQLRMRFRQGLALVALRTAEESACEGDLLLDDVRLVFSLEKEADHGIDEQAIVKGSDDGAYPRFPPGKLISGHPIGTSTPVASRTNEASVAKSSPRPLSS